MHLVSSLLSDLRQTSGGLQPQPQNPITRLHMQIRGDGRTRVADIPPRPTSHSQAPDVFAHSASLLNLSPLTGSAFPTYASGGNAVASTVATSTMDSALRRGRDLSAPGSFTPLTKPTVPAWSTPEPAAANAGPPSSETGMKRRREAHGPTIAAAGEPPWLKKPKTDRDGPISITQKLPMEFEGVVESSEDATKLLSEILETNLDAGESQIYETLDQMYRAHLVHSGGSVLSSVLGEGSGGQGLLAIG